MLALLVVAAVGVCPLPAFLDRYLVLDLHIGDRKIPVLTDSPNITEDVEVFTNTVPEGGAPYLYGGVTGHLWRVSVSNPTNTTLLITGHVHAVQFTSTHEFNGSWCDVYGATIVANAPVTATPALDLLYNSPRELVVVPGGTFSLTRHNGPLGRLEYVSGDTSIVLGVVGARVELIEFINESQQLFAENKVPLITSSATIHYNATTTITPVPFSGQFVDVPYNGSTAHYFAGECDAVVPHPTTSDEIYCRTGNRVSRTDIQTNVSSEVAVVCTGGSVDIHTAGACTVAVTCLSANTVMVWTIDVSDALVSVSNWTLAVSPTTIRVVPEDLWTSGCNTSGMVTYLTTSTSVYRCTDTCVEEASGIVSADVSLNSIPGVNGSSDPGVIYAAAESIDLRVTVAVLECPVSQLCFITTYRAINGTEWTNASTTTVYFRVSATAILHHAYTWGPPVVETVVIVDPPLLHKCIITEEKLLCAIPDTIGRPEKVVDLDPYLAIVYDESATLYDLDAYMLSNTSMIVTDCTNDTITYNMSDDASVHCVGGCDIGGYVAPGLRSLHLDQITRNLVYVYANRLHESASACGTLYPGAPCTIDPVSVPAFPTPTTQLYFDPAANDFCKKVTTGACSDSTGMPSPEFATVVGKLDIPLYPPPCVPTPSPTAPPPTPTPEPQCPGYTLGSLCYPIATCSTYEYEAVSPTLTSDRGCSVYTRCGRYYHISVGTTSISDVQCRHTKVLCLPGEYLNTSANLDAEPGQVINGEQCPACAHGKTTSSVYTHHNLTECTNVTCGPHRYMTTESVCRACTRCTHVSAPCTATSNTECLLRVETADPPCPENTYRDDSIPGARGLCRACSRCLYLKTKCTRKRDAVCATYGSEDYVITVVVVLFVLYSGGVSVSRIMPLLHS